MTQRSAETFRLDEQHLEFIRMAGAAFDPPSDNKSFITRTLLTGLRALLMTRRMPRWMADLQEKLTAFDVVSGCVRDSVSASLRRESADTQLYQRSVGTDTDSVAAGRPGSGARALPTPCYEQNEYRHAGQVATDSQGRLLKRPPRRIRPTTGVRAAVRVSGLADASLFTPFYGLRRTFAIGA